MWNHLVLEMHGAQCAFLSRTSVEHDFAYALCFRCNDETNISIHIESIEFSNTPQYRL